MMRRKLFLLVCLLISGCGYRAPMHSSYIPQVDQPYEGVDPEYQELAALMTKDTGMEPRTGNTVALLPDGQQKWRILKQDLEGARSSIYIDNYRFCTDSAGTIVAGILRERSLKGVDVRIILDKPANTEEHLRELSTLEEDGVELDLFRFPVMLLDYLWPKNATHRDHRKIVMVDGKTGYLGGRNIQDEYFFDWRDADIRITGPAVADMAAVYMENQMRVDPELDSIEVADNLELAAREDIVPELEQFSDVTVQIISDSPTDKSLPMRNCFEWAIKNAKEYFWFYNPYTPPPSSTIKALKEAASRGVDVRWIVPSINDVGLEKWMGESMYKELLQAGIRIWEWQDHILHAKQFMTDDALTAVGSVNMDNLSFFLNYEVEALVYDEAATRHASERFLAELEQNCIEVTLEDVRRWNFFRVFRNWFTRTFGGPIG